MRRRAATRVGLGLGIGVALLAIAGGAARAQTPAPSGIPTTVLPAPSDSVRRDSLYRDSVLRARRRDSLVPPMSPRRAFLTSLVIPGYAQSKLGRPTGSILFATMEVVAIGMARKAAQDLQEAKRASKDSVVASYTVNGAGELVPTYKQSRYTPERLKARRTHYEDWIAILIFNHIMSSADAFVAAHLWDFKPNVSADADSRALRVGARKAF